MDIAGVYSPYKIFGYKNEGWNTAPENWDQFENTTKNANPAAIYFQMFNCPSRSAVRLLNSVNWC